MSNIHRTSAVDAMPVPESDAVQPLSEAPPRPSRKRRRTVISCTECHRRKQKVVPPVLHSQRRIILTEYTQCDRNLPCSNCISRGKTSVCHYESEATILKRHSVDTTRVLSSEDGSPMYENGDMDDASKPNQDFAAQQLSALGYSKSNGMNTLGFVEKIQSQGRDGRLMSLETAPRQDGALREKYKTLIRQLPSRPYVDQLIETFFREINWHYCSLDRYAFDQHLKGWQNLSFQVINKGPQELPADLRFFPALLFQILALALQFQNPGQDTSLDALKYVHEMTLDDLASDYSESGADLLKLLGKRDITLVTIQAGFLRTSFLKNSGNVPEAWHSLSATIRDGQEIGLHKGSPITKSSTTAENALEQLWHTEDRRRMWSILSAWDPHMAMILGRPTTIDCRDNAVILPVDSPYTQDRRLSAPLPRANDDPPTPLTMIIASARGIELMRDILALEKEGHCPRDYSKIEAMHSLIVQRSESIPAYFRSDNPDTSFDRHPACYWLPESRPLFDTNNGFILMSLHRPYVFTIAKSRSEALKAALGILRAQRSFFQYLQAKHYKMFNLVLSTFDAIVLVAAIFILYPQENAELLSDALQHFEWAMERFDTMSERNQMAKAALGVLQAIHVRLMKALGRRGVKREASPPSGSLSVNSNDPRVAATSSSGQSAMSQSNRSSVSGISNNSTSMLNQTSPKYNEYPPPPQDMSMPASSMPGQSSYGIPSLVQNGNWDPYGNTMVPPPNFDASTFDLGNMAPLQPTHDLLFNDLVGMLDASAPAIGPTTSSFCDTTIPWQFEGEFKDDSFWNFMNQYHNS